MTDRFTPAQRSKIMSAIRSKNTKPELIVFRYLRQHKIYFQKHYYKPPVSMDVALPRKKIAIFIDGDFWHGRTFERRKDNLPPFWTAKIINNIKRDKRFRLTLKSHGWKILRVWEGNLTAKHTRMETLEKIKSFLTSN